MTLLPYWIGAFTPKTTFLKNHTARTGIHTADIQCIWGVSKVFLLET